MGSGQLLRELIERADYERSVKSYVDFFLEFIERHFGFKKSLFKLISRNFDSLSVISSRGISENFTTLSITKLGIGVSGKVALGGKPTIVENVLEIEELMVLRDLYNREGIRSLLSVPVATQHEAVGVLNIYEESPQRFKDKNVIDPLIDMLEFVAHLLRLILEKENASGKLTRLERYCTGLERVKSFHESIMESIPIGIVATDVRGYVVLMNKVLENMSLLSREECLGKRWFEVFGFEGEVRKKLELSFRTSTPQLFPLIDLPLKDGSVLPVEMKTDIIRNKDGNTIGVVAICSNIEEKRRIEQEIEKIDRLVVIGKLSAGIAHEIRNPLAGISGVIQVLREKFRGDPGLINIFDRVSVEIERLDGVVEKLNSIAFTKKMSFGTYSVNDLVEDSLFFIQKPLRDKGIKLIKNIDENIGSVLMDKDAIYQVLLNILINAMHAMPDGGNLIVETKIVQSPNVLGNGVCWNNHLGENVQIQRVKFGESFVCISISDDGVGIPKVILPKIFEAFFSTFKGGTGLGLYVSGKIIEQHSGLIGVYSERGKGSVFHILLPVKGRDRL